MALRPVLTDRLPFSERGLVRLQTYAAASMPRYDDRAPGTECRKYGGVVTAVGDRHLQSVHFSRHAWAFCHSPPIGLSQAYWTPNERTRIVSPAPAMLVSSNLAMNIISRPPPDVAAVTRMPNELLGGRTQGVNCFGYEVRLKISLGTMVPQHPVVITPRAHDRGPPALSYPESVRGSRPSRAAARAGGS